MSSTTMTEVKVLATTLPTQTHGKLRFIPSGHTPTPSPHNFHLPAIAEFGDVRTIPLNDMRPVPSVSELSTAQEGTAQYPTHGFTAVRHPSVMHSPPYTRKSWNEPKLLQQIYAPEMEEMVKRITGAKTVITDGYILRSALWSEADALATHAGHGEKKKDQAEAAAPKPDEPSSEYDENLSFPQFIGFSPTTGGASPAPKVHLDYSPQGARTHLRKYHPQLTSHAAPIIEAEERLLSQGLSLKEHYSSSPDCPRWALFSIWRPLKPVKRDPLALGDARSFLQEDYVPIVVTTPALGVPGKTETHSTDAYLAHASSGQKWYYISEQKPEEVLVIGLFDSARERETVAAGGTLHSSVDLPGTEGEEARESLELRCLAIW